jgi:hypothetical protein
MFDYKKLESQAGREELHKMASRYYQLTHDAIRRYDKHHLILGDRYEGRGRMAKEVLLAAKPYVDVLSFQYFGTPESIRRDLSHWHETIGRPTLLADTAKHIRVAEDRPVRSHDTDVYAAIMQVTQEMEHCLGIHLCGAYVQNQIRFTGLLKPDETPFDPAVTQAIAATNRNAHAWADSFRP